MGSPTISLRNDVKSEQQLFKVRCCDSRDDAGAGHMLDQVKQEKLLNLLQASATPHCSGRRGLVSHLLWNSCRGGTFRRCTSNLECCSTLSAARSLVGGTSLGSCCCHDHFVCYEPPECSSTHPEEALLQGLEPKGKRHTVCVCALMLTLATLLMHTC